MDYRVRHIQISAISQMCIGLICFALGIVQQSLESEGMGFIGFILSGIWIGMLVSIQNTFLS